MFGELLSLLEFLSGGSQITALESAWNSFYPARYHIDSQLIELNVTNCPFTIFEASALNREDGFIMVKSSTASDTHHAHITALAFDNEEAGTQMWDAAIKVLQEFGFQTVQFGGDWRHFFPGCPTECAELESFLVSKGMTNSGQQVDLERDLIDYDPPVTPSIAARPCTYEDRQLLERFFTGEFPGRWQTDTMTKFQEQPHRIIGLFLNGNCEGFAMTQLDGDQNRYAGAVWSLDLGQNWGALGAIGVSNSIRGQGYGDGLLAAALCSLRNLGARQTIIDWTTLVSFYGKHGFEVSRTYNTYQMKLV